MNQKKEFSCYVNNTNEALVFIKNGSEEDKKSRTMLVLIPFDGADDCVANMLYPELSCYFKMWKEWDYPLYGDRYSINFRRGTVAQWHNDTWCDPEGVDNPPVVVK